MAVRSFHVFNMMHAEKVCATRVLWLISVSFCVSSCVSSMEMEGESLARHLGVRSAVLLQR